MSQTPVLLSTLQRLKDLDEDLLGPSLHHADSQLLLLLPMT